MWVAIDRTMRDGPAMIKLRRLTGLDKATLLGHLTMLWLWAADNAPDGLLPNDADVLADAMEWPGDPAALLTALLDSGAALAGDDPATVELTHYAERMHGLMAHEDERREKARARTQRWRAKQRARDAGGNVDVTLRNDHGNVDVTPGDALHNTTHTTPHNTTHTERARAEGVGSNDAALAETWHGQRRAFWKFQQDYPKVVPDDLWALFREVVPAREVWEELAVGLALWLADPQWAENPQRFATAPLTFLRELRWTKPPKPSSRRTNAKARSADNDAIAAGWTPGASLGAEPVLPGVDDDPGDADWLDTLHTRPEPAGAALRPGTEPSNLRRLHAGRS